MMNFKLISNFIFTPAIFLIAGFCFSQQPSIKVLRNVISEGKFEMADSLIKNINTSSLSKIEIAELHYLNGKIKFNLGDYDIAYSKLKEARLYSVNIKNKRIQANTENLIIDCSSYLNEKDKTIDINYLITSLCQLAHELDDYLLTIYCHYQKGAQALKNKDYTKSKFHLKKVSEIALINNDSSKFYNNQSNIGMFIGHYENKPKEAIKIFNEIIPYFEKKLDYDQLFSSKYNLARQYRKLQHNQKAIDLLLEIDSIPIKTDILANKALLYSTISKYNELINNYYESHYYLKKANQKKDSLDLDTKTKKIAEIEAKYQTEKKDRQRLRNLNIAIGLGSSLVIVSLFAFFLQKNTRKKQRLAEQAKALESQKLATVLKEQELLSIDAMIEGQEKERQRIANDLHDDLGGLMATVKLHFNVLKDKPTPELYNKTTTLLDEAYQKIRSIAHAKNSGVIAKQGLLKAVQQMADKISLANKISLNVKDHGLENRLENSLELTIFRIIQELITNVIKHANATEATIHLTNHEDILNIMIEDNGIGFNPNQITTKHKGMGISSIDKRVEHLNGTMTIESEHQKGTTIIIDIPT